MGKSKRIMATLGDLYREMLYACGFMIAYWIPKNPTWFVCGTDLLVQAVTELSPFVRFDGYSAISDLANTPNMMLKSKQKNIIMRHNGVKHE